MAEGPDGSMECEYDLEADESTDAGIGTSTGLLGGPRGSVIVCLGCAAPVCEGLLEEVLLND